MPNYKIVYNMKDCIGVAACTAISEKYWEMNDENKAILKGSKLNEETGFYELEIPEVDLNEVLESARVCPVDVIMVYKIEDSGELIKLHPED